MGGVVADLDGATTVPGLYAVGETACTGLHGANRLASNSLTECFVFGARAAVAALDEPRGRRAATRPPAASCRSRRARRARRCGPTPALVRDRDGLARLLDAPHDLVPADRRQRARRARRAAARTPAATSRGPTRASTGTTRSPPATPSARARAGWAAPAAPSGDAPAAPVPDLVLTDRSAINTNFIFVAFELHTAGATLRASDGTGEEASQAHVSGQQGDLPGAVARRRGRSRPPTSTCCARASRRSSGSSPTATTSPGRPARSSRRCAPTSPSRRRRAPGRVVERYLELRRAAPGRAAAHRASTPTATRCSAGRRPGAGRRASGSRSTHNGYCPSHQHLADTEDLAPSAEPLAA